MRIVIFHDFLIERGGGERVVRHLAKFFKALIVTCFYDKKSTYEEFEKVKILYGKLFLNKIAQKVRSLKLLRTTLFFSQQLKNYANFFNKNFDIAIFSGFYSLCLGKFLKIPKIYYIHSEPLSFVFKREAYRKKLFLLYEIVYKLALREMEREGIFAMSKVVANSNFTREIYENFFGVKVDNIIYPPVDTLKFYWKKSEDFFLAVGRLHPHKRIHVITDVFKKIKSEKLIIVGEGPLASYIKRVTTRYTNINYLGGVSDKKLRELYAKCKAVIYIPEKEPFGIIPIEANASGKPAIVGAEGGLLETIVDGKTGIAIKPPYEKNLAKIIKSFDDYYFDPKKCIFNARKFGKKNFLRKIKKIIKRIA